jgi:hypothetical protein
MVEMLQYFDLIIKYNIALHVIFVYFVYIDNYTNKGN